MKKFLRVTFSILLILAFCGAAFAAGQTVKPSKSELKRMSVFISNFTEAGLFNFDLTADEADEGGMEFEEPITHLGNPANVTELIRFGILHNLINNRDSRIRKCKDKNCEAGELTIDRKFVEESVKKYFDIDLAKKDLRYVDPEENPSVVFSFDGKLFHFAAESFREPDNDMTYYADVQGVTQRGKYLLLAGDIYNSRKITDRPGIFAATVKPYKWNGKDTWAIIDMTTDWVTNAGRD